MSRRLTSYSPKSVISREKWLGVDPINIRGAGERHKIVRQTDSGFGVDAQAGLGSPSSPEALLIRSLPHDLVMGRMARAGSQHVLTFKMSFSSATSSAGSTYTWRSN